MQKQLLLTQKEQRRMTDFNDIFSSKNVALLLGGLVVGAASVTLLQNEKVRDALSTGISEAMKMRDNLQTVTAAIKEDAEDKYAQKIQEEHPVILNRADTAE